jgi:hypothetical protein
LAERGYVTAFTGIIAVVLAVARDVPIVEVFGYHDSPAGHVAAVVITVPFSIAAGFYYWGGVNMPLAVIWPICLGYFWCCIGWRLRNTAP